MWTPSPRIARRCGARLLRAYRTGVIEIPVLDATACIDACTNSWLSRNLCKKMGILWLKWGRKVMSWEDDESSISKKTMDEEIDRALEHIA